MWKLLGVKAPLSQTVRDMIFKHHMPYFWQDMKNIVLVQEKILFSSLAQNDSALPEEPSLVLSTAIWKTPELLRREGFTK